MIVGTCGPAARPAHGPEAIVRGAGAASGAGGAALNK